jgi:hypothetical protein
VERCGIVVQTAVWQSAAGCVLWSGVLLRYRERSVSVQLAVYYGAVCYCGTESGLSVCSWLCIVERCETALQRVVCQCAAGCVLWSGVKLRYREQSVSVQLVVYCGAVWHCGTESGLSVCSWLCILERCETAVQRAVCQCAAGCVLWSGLKLRYRCGLLVCSWWCIVERCGIVVQRAVC